MIVVGVDYSEESRDALRWAQHEGRVAGLPVTAVHAGPPVYEPVAHTPLAEERRAARRPALDAFVAETGGGAVTVEIADGPPGRALVGYSAHADLVVVGRHGKGAVERVLTGSTTHEVVRHARSPVAVVPRHARAEARRVVVGSDGSDDAAAAVRWATAAALRRRVPLVVVRAAYDAIEDAFAADVVAKVRADVGGAVPVEAVVTRLGPVPALLTEAGPDELLVVGTRGLGGVARVLLGSTSATVVERSRCPVVVVPYVA